MSAFCSASEVRDIINLSTDDISDAEIDNLINLAQIQIAQELYSYHEDEEVEYINDEKDNDIDGSNKTFYTRYWPIADSNHDGQVTTADIKVYKFDSEGNRTEVTVSSVDAERGKFVLAEAPTTDYTLKVTYWSRPPNITNNDLKLACILLTASLCYLKVQPQFLKHMDTLDIIRMPDAAEMYYNKYKELIHRLKSEAARKVKDTETVTMEDVKSLTPSRF